MHSYKEIDKVINSKKVILTKNESTIPYVVFIMGESTDKNHMGIYGYKNNTTPLLEKREVDDELYVFQDVIASANYTNASLGNVFTFHEKGSSKQWYEYENLFDILKAAGYYTSWISNQETTGVYGSTAHVYASRCDVSKFTEIRDSRTIHRFYDDKLLPLLDDSLSVEKQKQFFVIHLEGTHEEYKERYPKEFEKFSMYDENGSNDKQRQIKAEYDNAVLYNDFIVNEIIRRFEDMNAIIIYISDHGNEVCEESDFHGHSSETVGNLHMIEIPMLIWTSKRFKEAYPTVDKKIRSSINHPYMTDDLINTILNLMDIEVNDYDKKKSIINDDFDFTRKRIYNGKEYVR